MNQNHPTGLRRSTRLRKQPTTTFTDDSAGIEEVKEGANKMSRRGKNLKRSRDEESDDLAASQVSPKRSRTCQKKSRKLCVLPTLPLDVLYTILGHVNPKALVSLTRVNRAFRATLLSPEIDFIWAQVRKSCDVPEPWEDMSEVEWARLLFGSTKCQSCGTKGVQRVDFILMKRVCFVCIQANGISKGRFRGFYPDEDKGVLELVEHTRGGGRANNTQYYDKKRIERILSHLSVCRNESEVDAYVEEKKAYLDRLSVHTRLGWDWDANVRYQCFKNRETTREERIAAIRVRLREMGYTDEDIDDIIWKKAVYKTKPLTERSWKKLKIKLPPMIWDYRGLRHIDRLHAGELSPSTAAIVTSRCNLISERYFSYKRALTPLKWRLKGLPSVQTIWGLPSMRKLIGLPENVELTSAMVQNAITDKDYAEELEDIIGTFVHATVAYNRHQKQSSRDEVFSKWLLDSDVERPEFNPGDILQDSATVQTFCRNCKFVCTSLSEFLWHLTGPCLLRLQTNDFWERTDLWGLTCFHSYSAAGLVWASFGEERLYDATGDEMDAKGDWYRCMKCGGKDNGVEVEGFIGTWRECITHGHAEGQRIPGSKSMTEVEDQGRHNPLFQLLDRDEAEALHLKDERKRWSCAHRTVNAEQLWTREAVLAHLKDTHNKSEVSIPDDYFHGSWSHN